MQSSLAHDDTHITLSRTVGAHTKVEIIGWHSSHTIVWRWNSIWLVEVLISCAHEKFHTSHVATKAKIDTIVQCIGILCPARSPSTQCWNETFSTLPWAADKLPECNFEFPSKLTSEVTMEAQVFALCHCNSLKNSFCLGHPMSQLASTLGNPHNLKLETLNNCSQRTRFHQVTVVACQFCQWNVKKWFWFWLSQHETSINNTACDWWPWCTKCHSSAANQFWLQSFMAGKFQNTQFKFQILEFMNCCSSNLKTQQKGNSKQWWKSINNQNCCTCTESQSKMKP